MTQFNTDDKTAWVRISTICVPEAVAAKNQLPAGVKTRAETSTKGSAAQRDGSWLAGRSRPDS